MRAGKLTSVLTVLTCLGTAPLAAQTRSDLVEQARNEFDPSVRLDLLTRAADPALGARDSVWAVGVFDLAQSLIGGGEDAAGSLWLRWAARHGPQWTIDRTYYSPSTVAAYDRAVPTVQTGGGLGSPSVTTDWRWPSGFDAGADGTLVVEASDGDVPLTVTVQGGGTVAPGGSLALEPATYELVAEAPGFEATTVTREVLPGVATVLRFDLAPLLPAATESRVSPALVTIRYTQGGQAVCANGLMARPGGLVLTSGSALGSEGGFEIETATGVYRDVPVAARDARLDLAVLRLEATQQPTLPPATGVTDGQDVWSLFRSGCEDPTSARTRLAGWRTPPAGPVGVAPGLPAGALGGPLFDRAGGLIGLVTGPDRVAPIGLAEELLARAARELVAEAQVGPGGGGGLPWVWIGAGAAAAGVAAVVLGGGGGGGGNGEEETTGSIQVTWPGGGTP
jgi:hypothetical protein